MKIKVNPTRMELLKLKKRYAIAKRGHKLLKDKEEQLLIEFRKILKQVREKRKEMEEKLIEFYKEVIALKGITEKNAWKLLLKNPLVKTEIKIEKYRIFNIPTKRIKFNVSKIYPDYFSSPYYHYLIKKAISIFQYLCELAEIEDKLISFSFEIERTRRRVNALEYVLIPNIQEAIKFIRFKIEEYERSSLIRLKHLQLSD